MMKNGEQQAAEDSAEVVKDTIKREKSERRKSRQSKDQVPSEEVKDQSESREAPQERPPPAEDGDDPVVHEIPVFLAKSLANQLYLLQVRCM